VCMCVCVYGCIHACVRACIHACVHVCVQGVHVCMCMHMCVHACVYVYMCIEGYITLSGSIIIKHYKCNSFLLTLFNYRSLFEIVIVFTMIIFSLLSKLFKTFLVHYLNYSKLLKKT